MECKYSIEDLDFSKCTINPVQETSVLVMAFERKHRDFKKYFGEFFTRRKAKLFQYIIFVYDKKSPLVKKEPKLEDRKIQAVLLAGILVKDEIPEEMIQVMEGTNADYDNVYFAIARYMLLNPDPLHISLVTYYQLLIGYNVSVAKNTDIKNNAMAKAIKETTDNIRETEELMFGGDEGSEIRRIITSSMDIKDIDLRPETVARNKENA